LKVVKWGLSGLALAVGAGVIAFGVASFTGSARAQEETEKAAQADRYEELLAQQLGISVDELKAAQKAARDQMIDEAVAAGRLTPEQAERLKSLEPGELRGFKHRVVHALKNVLDSAAKALGLTTAEVREGLADGKSIADLAADQGKNIDDVKSAMIDDLEAAIDQAVTDGKLTAERAANLKQRLNDHIDDIVNHEGGFRGRFRLHRGPAPDAGDTQ